MRHKELCPGKAATIWKETNHPELQGFQGFGSSRPSVKVKRVRIKCELCGRRVWSSVQVDHDGGIVFHTIPSHKPKGWWKIKKTKHRREKV